MTFVTYCGAERRVTYCVFVFPVHMPPPPPPHTHTHTHHLGVKMLTSPRQAKGKWAFLLLYLEEFKKSSKPLFLTYIQINPSKKTNSRQNMAFFVVCMCSMNVWGYHERPLLPIFSHDKRCRFNDILSVCHHEGDWGVGSSVARCRETRGNLCHPVSPIFALKCPKKITRHSGNLLLSTTEKFRNVTHFGRVKDCLSVICWLVHVHRLADSTKMEYVAEIHHLLVLRDGDGI